MMRQNNLKIEAAAKLSDSLEALYFSLLLLLTGLVLCVTPASAGDRALIKLSLEELMEMEVTSVARKPQKRSDSAAAIYVITQEDLRRAGVNSVPEALRLVPGIQVAKVDAHRWAISARGSNNTFANKLLVLVDGRSVYTPLFAGVYWSEKDYLLEDIDRIEVIRGPGATLWGANAVNGIINIITKDAADTEGGLLSLGGGSEEYTNSGVRYGSKVGENGALRLYAKGQATGDSKPVLEQESHDAWSKVQSGFRYDYDDSGIDKLTLQGDLYYAEEELRVTLPSFSPPFAVTTSDTSDVSGGNLLSRYQHTYSEESDSSLQLYWDRTDREETFAQQTVDTLDLDFQHRWAGLEGHEVLWGFGYRYVAIDMEGIIIGAGDFSPDANVVSGFVQDEIEVLEDKLKFIVGTKLEHNDYTGIEVQPTARLLWTPNATSTFWSSFSRALRTPSQGEDSTILDTTSFTTEMGLPGIIRIVGNNELKSEELLAYEAGYRQQVNTWLQFDVSAFYNSYNDATTLSAGTPAPVMTETGVPVVVVPLEVSSEGQRDTYGVEGVLDLQPLDWWRMQFTYTYWDTNDTGGGTDLELGVGASSTDPHHQATVQSRWDLCNNFEFDQILRYVDYLNGLDIDSYLELDLRLGWHLSDSIEFSVVGFNLLDSQHQEFLPTVFQTPATYAERSVFGKVVWRF
ncbi:TonB-dependent receptor [Oligoflexia bacterium]|nr:TonB-dependent receptor [Oligoflexia bacterium]